MCVGGWGGVALDLLAPGGAPQAPPKAAILKKKTEWAVLAPHVEPPSALVQAYLRQVEKTQAERRLRGR
jgi:hypothetical protein